jgi:putative tricarboxylic transport membrane protein
MGDRLFGVIGLALAGFFIWQATQIQTSFISDPVGPKAFPMIVGGVLGLASLVMVLRPDPRPNWPAAGPFLEIAVAALVMVIYALALPRVGFVVATAIASGLLSWRLGASPLGAGLAGVLIALGIYVIFHLILGLSLATGPLGI